MDVRYVYAILTGDDRFVKIGIAKDVAKRIASLQVGNPTKLRVWRFWSSDYAQTTEAELHSKLASFRAEGEWFVWTVETREIIERYFHWRLPQTRISSILSTGDARLWTELKRKGVWYEGQPA